MGGFIPTCHAQAFAEMTKVEIDMTLRCKHGDLAIIINDVTETGQKNIGRIVSVRGPTRYFDFYKLICWRIKPVTRQKFWVDYSKGIELLRSQAERVYWNDPVHHPDAWLLPIRPKDEDIDLSDAEQVLRMIKNKDYQFNAIGNFILTPA